MLMSHEKLQRIKKLEMGVIADEPLKFGRNSFEQLNALYRSH